MFTAYFTLAQLSRIPQVFSRQPYPKCNSTRKITLSQESRSKKGRTLFCQRTSGLMRRPHWEIWCQLFIVWTSSSLKMCLPPRIPVTCIHPLILTTIMAQLILRSQLQLFTTLELLVSLVALLLVPQVSPPFERHSPNPSIQPLCHAKDLPYPFHLPDSDYPHVLSDVDSIDLVYQIGRSRAPPNSMSLILPRLTMTP